MKHFFKNGACKLFAAACMCSLLVCAFYALPSRASSLMYSVQTGRFHDLEKAREQCESLLNVLNREDLAHLRIVENGRSYFVRLGRFTDPFQAVNFHLSIRRLLPDTVLTEGDRTDGGMKTVYVYDPGRQRERTNAEHVPATATESPASQDEVYQTEASRFIYTVQAGSYKLMKDAWRHYDAIMKALAGDDRDYLRIEKVGQFYAVRIGKFQDREHGELFHQHIKNHIAESLLMKAFIKDERVIKLHSNTPSKDKADTGSHESGEGA